MVNVVHSYKLIHIVLLDEMPNIFFEICYLYECDIIDSYVSKFSFPSDCVEFNLNVKLEKVDETFEVLLST